MHKDRVLIKTTDGKCYVVFKSRVKSRDDSIYVRMSDTVLGIDFTFYKTSVISITEECNKKSPVIDTVIDSNGPNTINMIFE